MRTYSIHTSVLEAKPGLFRNRLQPLSPSKKSKTKFHFPKTSHCKFDNLVNWLYTGTLVIDNGCFWISGLYTFAAEVQCPDLQDQVLEKVLVNEAKIEVEPMALSWLLDAKLDDSNLALVFWKNLAFDYVHNIPALSCYSWD